MRFVLALYLLVGVARADNVDARTHYQRATTHFAVGEFAQAADEYEAAFKLKPDPALLYNAAQAHRLAGNLPKALILYKNYMMLYPKSPNLAAVRQQITKLEEAISAGEKAKFNPPSATAEPGRSVTEPPPEPPPAPPPAATAAAPAPAPPPEKRPYYKKWWFPVAIVGGVVVIGAVVTAVVVTQTSTTKPWNDLPAVGPGSQMGLRF
jgi:tetratricopeptide (TPR) repeat protein